MITLMLAMGSAIPVYAAEGDMVIVTGSIESLGASSITVQGVTLSVGVGTSIFGESGPLAFADLDAGMRVVAVGVEQSDGSILATLIVVLPEATPEPTETPTNTPTPTDTPTATATPTHTFTPTATLTDTSTPTATPTSTVTPTATLTGTLTPTVTPGPSPTPEPTGTPEPERCHPVALAISVFFGLECKDVTELHESGVGFGVIGRAYLTALASEGQLTPEEAIEMHQSGTGWGQMMKEFGVHPGGKGLGAIMRGTFDSPLPTPGSGSDDDANATGALNDGSGPGNSDKAPGHNKDSQDNRPGHGNGNGRDNKPADKPKKKP